jgi:Ser/Thr protein kinase RdoA (MazF antagonist)
LLDRPDRLPDLGAGAQLAALRQARRALAAHRDDPSLSRAEAATARRLTALLDDVQGGWRLLEAVCAELPPTVVHGDLVRKNLQVDRVTVVAFDWEKAGWGPAAIDLAQSTESPRFAANACLDSYRSARSLTNDEVERQAIAGTVLRCLTAIDWKSQGIDHDAAGRSRALEYLELYRSWLDRNWRALQTRVAA